MNEIVYMGFILPGFFVISTLRLLLRRFAKDADVFDRTLYSLFCNVPVLLLTLWILNCDWVVNVINNVVGDFNGLKKIDDIINFMLPGEVKRMVILLLAIAIATLIVTILIWLTIISVGKLINLKRGHQTNLFQTVYESCFVDVKDIIPAKICNLESGETITEGFIREVSLYDENEFLLVDSDTYKYCVEQGWITTPESVYLNVTKGIKVEIYNIDDMITVTRKGNDNEQNQKTKRRNNRRAKIC